MGTSSYCPQLGFPFQLFLPVVGLSFCSNTRVFCFASLRFASLCFASLYFTLLRLPLRAFLSFYCVLNWALVGIYLECFTLMVFTTSPSHRLISDGVGGLVHSLSMEKTGALSPYTIVKSQIFAGSTPYSY